MRAIQSPSTDPRFNLALEQYIFDQMPRNRSYLMLWRNDRTIVVGKHQDTFAEINADYVRANQIQVVRRLSGGGAVYHDLGNVNFTFIADHTGSDFDFSTFCRPVIWALESLGVPAELNGRNDMTIRGRKFSGNSQYVKEGRVMHHGTLLYDSDLSVVSSALAPSRDKLTPKGLPSVRSRVTNIKPYMHQPMPTESFMERLWSCLGEVCDLVPYELDRGSEPGGAYPAGGVRPLGVELWKFPPVSDRQAPQGRGLRRDPGLPGFEGGCNPGAVLLWGLLLPKGTRPAGPAVDRLSSAGGSSAGSGAGGGNRAVFSEHGPG